MFPSLADVPLVVGLVLASGLAVYFGGRGVAIVLREFPAVIQARTKAPLALLDERRETHRCVMCAIEDEKRGTRASD